MEKRLQMPDVLEKRMRGVRVRVFFTVSLFLKACYFLFKKMG